MDKRTSKMSLNRSISSLIALVPYLLIGGCQSSVQTYSSCEQNKGNQTLLLTRVDNPKQISQNSLDNVTFNNPKGIKFEAKKGQTFFYTAEDFAISNKKSGGSFCILVRENSTNKALDSYALNHLPSDGFYTIEVYSLDRNETINQNISIKASLNSDNYIIPSEVELKALYQFKDTRLALLSLDDYTNNTIDFMVQSAAEKEVEDYKLTKNESKQSKQDHYNKLVEDKNYRTEKIKDILAIYKLNVIGWDKDSLKTKEIIEAIYIFQVQFLDKDVSQISTDGMLNLETKKALVSLILNEEKNIKRAKPEPNANKNFHEYKAKITNRVQRYFLNIYEQRCNENWQMLGNTTKKLYGNKKFEYAKYCFHDLETDIEVKDRIVSPQLDPDAKEQKEILGCVDFQRFKNVNVERFRFYFAPFSTWDGKSDIKIDVTSDGSCRNY